MTFAHPELTLLGHASELEGPEGAVPADAFEATDGDKITGVTQGGARVGGEGRRWCVPLLSSACPRRSLDSIPKRITGLRGVAAQSSGYWRHGKSRPHAGKAALLPWQAYSLSTTCVAGSERDGDRSTRRPLASERSAKTAARTKTLVSPWVKTSSARIAGAAPTSR